MDDELSKEEFLEVGNMSIVEDEVADDLPLDDDAIVEDPLLPDDDTNAPEEEEDDVEVYMMQSYEDIW